MEVGNKYRFYAMADQVEGLGIGWGKYGVFGVPSENKNIRIICWIIHIASTNIYSPTIG